MILKDFVLGIELKTDKVKCISIRKVVRPGKDLKREGY